MDPQLVGRHGLALRTTYANEPAPEKPGKDYVTEGFGTNQGWPDGRDENSFKADPAWEKFVDQEGRPWWWRERDGHCFYEPTSGTTTESRQEGPHIPGARMMVTTEEGRQRGQPADTAPLSQTKGHCARPGCGFLHKQGPRQQRGP